MDAVEYIKALRRLCKMQKICNECLYGCPLRLNGDCIAGLCDDGLCDGAEKAAQIVEQWSKDHHVKTRQSEFLKMFPNAQMSADGDVIWMCPKYISYDYRPEENCHEISCGDCKRKFWLTEVTDND